MNATLPLTSPQTAQRGFPGIRCPLCGESDSMTLNLCEVTTFKCQECDEEQSVEDIQAMLAAWQRVLTWVEMAPAIEE